LSQAATPIIAALPTLPPSAARPYVGSQATGATRASLQRALDNYKTGHINLPCNDAASDLSRSDTASFGESHASELSSIDASDSSIHTQSGLPVTPPAESIPSHTPIDPNVLNQTPAIIPIPSSQSPAMPPASLDFTPTATTKLPPVIPTVAETGVPVSAGPTGPGPASGSLQDIRAASASAGPRSEGLPGNETQTSYGQGVPPAADALAPKYESAASEKARLRQEDREHSLQGDSSIQQSHPVDSAGPSHETAEEEKKRLQREERERVLRQGTSALGTEGVAGKDEDLPPYQDY
jgi:hypothetical protein